MFTATGRTLCRHLINETAVMTGELVDIPMERQTHITTLTAWHPTTFLTHHHRGESSAILKEDRLLSTL